MFYQQKNIQMKKTITFLIIVLFAMQLSSQNKKVIKDSILQKSLNEVVITALRSVTPMKEIPAAISVVQDRQLNSLNKSIAADEILQMVPGVKVDNGTDGSRVHLYIRGQGVLAESGFRGIAVFIDGISVNDPGGYCPDLYDVDWWTVKNVEVVKGLTTSMYGGSATGGVVNISTMDGGKKPVTETFMASAGSYGFSKVMDQVDGTSGNVNYRVSYSHTQGNGYRQHQAFMSDNFSEKLNWTPTNKIKITEMVTYTNYFNQNSEGMNLARIRGDITFGPQADNIGWRASNNDAVPYNEFHTTKRLTASLIGKFDICKNQDITVKGFYRMNNYRETSNNGDDYKPYINPGVSVQYNLVNGKNNLINHFSVGADYSSQTINEHEFAVPGEFQRDSNRVDSHFGQSCFDLPVILINQIIRQRSAGAFIIDKLDIYKKLFFIGSLRYDYVYNRVANDLDTSIPDSLSGSRTFQKPTYSLGLVYDVSKALNVYANFGTGYLVPTNDDLYNNPSFYGGLNTTIKPATSQGEELGVRGDIKNYFHYDVTGFYMNTKNGFYRYSIPGRGNNTAFFGNKEEKKWGIETFVSYSPVKFITIDAAYTYSHFIYPANDSIGAHFIPECPQHMLAAEIAFRINKNFSVTVGTEFQSSWKLQVDDTIYDNYHIGATYYQNYSTESSTVTAYDKNNKPMKYGYNIYNAGVSYNWKLGKLEGELSFYAKNIFNQHYFGFTEPNNGVDYNSYQPAPGREFFGSLKLKI
jgi:iron complex outermembrane receptor protein